VWDLNLGEWVLFAGQTDVERAAIKKLNSDMARRR
jgi:hypothetical protein